MRQILIVFFILNLTPLSWASPAERKQWRTRLISSCTAMLRKNSPRVKSPAKYCACAADAHLKPKDVSETEVKWLEDLYRQKLSDEDIQADPYGLADFELDVELQCRPLRK